jgi:type IV pilus assembly protein PilA
MLVPCRRPQHPTDESGFGLIELLVVILILSVLAAIAIPLFLSQTDKAKDVTAKAQVRSAATAAEAYATEHNGEYKGLAVARLKEIEPTLSDESTAKLVKAEPKSGGVLVQSEAIGTKARYSIERTEGGQMSRTCEPENAGGCPAGGTW